MNRPYKVSHGKLVGVIVIILSGILSIFYIVPLPFSSSVLVAQEWIVLGVIFYFH
ncbi:hypothetical protein [Anaerostipes sp. MSJ-23]|uniref:hypothetical protein n=1 Tax=unclassified Anaerostipes TaxID=2635253 RepID=UPI001C115181|nr:hypothetical protein [Anaerostipes sp. MSJ-23]MBU5459625.1 hypothetical protein [Anaerostipes sp. MSJ-23]